MMYILTQEEFDALQVKKRVAEYESTKILQDLCTRVADNEILTSGWKKGHPWGCIITHDDWYCDDCPVRKVCPKEWKRLSK